MKNKKNELERVVIAILDQCGPLTSQEICLIIRNLGLKFSVNPKKIAKILTVLSKRGKARLNIKGLRREWELLYPDIELEEDIKILNRGK
ncbi:MAG: hypothetical protein DRI61_00840 [Chloroflexi bacterium]|nr:MAG: hypothetical protein DRI61_00840 [Chloroflexota bacterium]